MEKYSVCEVAPLDGQRVLQTRWVFRQKIKADGRPGEAKARLGAKGFTQREGLDFNNIYAGVAHKDTFRVCPSIACACE